jgi:hypothetical protein
VAKSVDQIYANEVYSKYGYLANWPPGAPVELGDVGTLRRALFTRRRSLGTFGESRVGGLQSATYQNGGVSFEVKAAGDSEPGFRRLLHDHAGIAVTFRQKGAFFIQFVDCQEVQVEDLDDVRGKMHALRDAGEVAPGDVVVTSVMRALRSTVLISQRTSGRLELRAPDIIAGGGVGQSPIPDLGVFAPVYESGMYKTMYGQAGVIPLFGGLRLRERPWTKRMLIEDLVHGDRGEHGFEPGPDADPWFDRVGLR